METNMACMDFLHDLRSNGIIYLTLKRPKVASEAQVPIQNNICTVQFS